jgi:peptidyl-prolyl cis-trans isomerase B (cyclophilin B)
MIPRPIRSLALLAAVVASTACSAQPGASASPPVATPASSVGAGGGTDCPTAQPAALPAGETRSVKIETVKGTITLGLEADLSPIAVGNFVALAECGFYDGVVFHRLVPGFVIQGGDPDGTGTGGPGYAIADEPLVGDYRRGTVAMARTPAPDSQGSQFFLVLDDAAEPALTSAQFPYAILGEVTAGMDVVDAIAAMPNSGGPSNTALDPVAMDRVTVTEP